MNKRGIALILGLLVLLVLTILLSAFIVKTVNENNLVKRHIASTRAFWTAEAGLAEAKRRLTNGSFNGTFGSYNYEIASSYPATRAVINNSNYYDVQSRGIVPLAQEGDIRRTINAVIKTGPIDDSKFPYAIDAANDLCFGGNCKKPAEDYLDPDICNGHACWKEKNTALNFLDLFGYEQSAVKNLAIQNGTYYTESNFPTTVNGVTWVDVSNGSTLMIGTSTIGQGLMIVNGDLHVGGGYQFKGIIYVLGTLTARGTFDSYGSIVVASTAGIDSINGTPTFHWDINEIHNALLYLSLSTTSIVSWKESP